MPKYNGYETPEYQVIDGPVKDASYEVRKYPTAKWTSTEVSSPVLDGAPSTGFRRLFNYITGKNESGNTISMTCPVTIAVNNRESAFANMKTIVSFYVPTSHQEKPPVPTADDVYTEDRKETTVYVKTFGGFAKSKDWYNQVTQLREDLIKDGVKEDQIKNDMFYAVSYDNPYKFFWRRNEVWITKKSNKETLSSNKNKIQNPMKNKLQSFKNDSENNEDNANLAPR